MAGPSALRAGRGRWRIWLALLAMAGCLLAGAQAQEAVPDPASLLNRVNTLSGLLRELELRSDQLQAQLEQARVALEEERLVRSGEAMREHLRETDRPELAWSLNDAGLLMASEGRLVEAQLLFERALAMLEKHYELMHPARGTVLQNLGEVLWLRQDPVAADRYREAALVFATVAGGTHPRLAAVLNAWATQQASQGKPEEAETLYRRVIGIYEAQGERYPLDLVAPLHNLALLQLSRHQVDEAGRLLDRARGLLRKNHETGSPRALLVLRALARQRQAAGNAEEAVRYEKQAAELALKLMDSYSGRTK